MRELSDTRLIQGRARVLMMFIGAALVICAIGYWFVQIARGNQYKIAAENNQYHEGRIAAPRGKMLDRTGKIILVDNRPSFNLYFLPEYSADHRADIASLGSLIGLSRTRIEELRTKASRPLAVQPILVREDIPFELMAYFEARKSSYPWVSIVVDQKRSYPYGPFASHVLGRVGEVTESQLEQEAYSQLQPGMMVGQNGLEVEYQNVLMGSDGSFVVIKDSIGRTVREVSRESPTSGQDLILTLDYELQNKAEELFLDKAGALVALDVHNGEVLALVSAPSYDPNFYVERFSELSQDESSPLLNRAISSTFSPGSVWKFIMASAALKEGIVTPTTKEFCAGSVHLVNRNWDCNGVHEWMDVTQAITRSCNIFFYKAGNKLGIEKIEKWAGRFGFGELTGIDLPNEKSGLVPTPEWLEETRGLPWYPADTVSISIGQGALLVTPVQLAVAMSAVANGGKIVQPHLIRGIRTTDGSTGLLPIPTPSSVGIGDEVLHTVREGLWGVVNNGGTAVRARIPQISVAGKTGTAQIVDKKYWRDDMPEELRHHTWFVCFAPYENPKIAVAVFVEHGQSSSRSAVPLAAEFLRTYAANRERLAGEFQQQAGK